MQNQSPKLWKKVNRWRWIFSLCPWVRQVFVVNSLAHNKAKATSDIDLLIVTDNNKALSARFFLVLVTQFFGLRVHGNKIAGRFCLSFIVDHAHADLHKLMHANDTFLKHFYTQKKLIFERSKTPLLLRLVAFFTPQSLIIWHSNRALARAQNNAFKNPSIVISDSIFKFHENDGRN